MNDRYKLLKSEHEEWKSIIVILALFPFYWAGFYYSWFVVDLGKPGWESGNQELGGFLATILFLRSSVFGIGLAIAVALDIFAFIQLGICLWTWKEYKRLQQNFTLDKTIESTKEIIENLDRKVHSLVYDYVDNRYCPDFGHKIEIKPPYKFVTDPKGD